MKKLEVIKGDKKGKKYKYDNFVIFSRKKGIISGDNNVNKFERILLISGKAEIILEKKVFEVEAPYEIILPEKTYHKIVGITDITFIIFKK